MSAAPNLPPATWPSLTPRERQVADMLVRGYTNREIAERIEIDIKTVDTHRINLMRKMAARNNVALTRYAIRNGFVSAAAEDDASEIGGVS